MNIIGIERIVYGVTDLAACARYMNDWGFLETASGATGATFETAEKTVVSLRAHDDPSLPALRHKSAFFQGSCGREVIWGAGDASTLSAIAGELSRDRIVTEDSDGTLHSHDDAGNAIGFCLTRRVPVVQAPLAFNLVGAPVRINRPADGAAKNMIARPIRINHVVYMAIDGEAARVNAGFYQSRLGFRLSDNVGDQGFFMRPAGSHDHHNILVEAITPGSFGLQHSAYEFRDLDHIMHRGRFLETQGWESHNGPGRHTVGSNLTWYFWTPMGGLMELISDMDYLTEEWQPRFIDPKVAGRPIAWTSRPNGDDFRFGVPAKS
jgi:catechol 2,3-dioxygenase-like lactoylglutathione lyase family enzyme